MKFDVSDRSHEQAPPGKSGGLIERTLINLSGIPADYAYEHGSQQERSDLKALGAILLGSSALTSITATAGLHLAMGDGGFHPWYAAAGIFVGALTGAIDYLVQYKGTLASRGLSEKRRAGLKLPDSESTNRLPQFVRVARVGQAATFGWRGKFCAALCQFCAVEFLTGLGNRRRNLCNTLSKRRFFLNALGMVRNT
jgi:hypothetical protein